MSDRTSPGVAPVEMLLDWEGPAINDPATADSQAIEGFLADPATLPSASLWVAVTIASVVLGNGVCDALRAKVVSFLAAWRSRHGQGKLDELKQQVLGEIQKQRTDPQQSEALRQAAEQLFDRAGE
jgi:hypothetical protein